MMTIRNLGSKGNLWVKFKDGIWAELCLKLWFEKVTVQKSIAEPWTIISDQRLSISFPMHGLNKLVILNMTYLYETLPIKLLAQELIKILSSCFQKLDCCFFLKYSFGELWTVTSNHKGNKYWADLLSLNKNIMWYGFY